MARNVLEAVYGELGVVDDGGRWPDELRGVNKCKRFARLVGKFSSEVVDEMDDLRTRIIEEQTKSGALRDENLRLRDKNAKLESENMQLKLRQRLEAMQIAEADRVKILECTK